MRIKRPAIRNQADFDRDVASVVAAQEQLDNIQQEIDVKLQAIRAPYVEREAALKSTQEAAISRIETYVKKNRTSILGNKKSVVLRLAKLGFRSSSKTIFPKGEAHTIEQLKANDQAAETVKVSSSVIKAKAAKLSESLRRKCGISIETAETFFFEPKKDAPQTNNRQKAA